MSMTGPYLPGFHSWGKIWKISPLTINQVIETNTKVQAIMLHMRQDRRYHNIFVNGMMPNDYQKTILKVVYEKELAALQDTLITTHLWDRCSLEVNSQLRYCSPHQTPDTKFQTVLRAIFKSAHFANSSYSDQNAVKGLILATCYQDSIDDLSKDLSPNQLFVDAVNEAYQFCFSDLKARL